MSKIQFNVNIANGVAIDLANDELPVWWMEVYHFWVTVTNQNHCYMPKLNDTTVFKNSVYMNSVINVLIAYMDDYLIDSVIKVRILWKWANTLCLVSQ